MMRTLIVIVALGISLLVSGCATTDQHANMGVVVTPVAPDQKLELTLARLNEILAKAELTDEQRARFHYDRGVRYDSVGLKVLARIDFHQALKLQPNLVDAYNFLGIYYTQDGEYESAYEAFDGVLELSPEYDYAYLNRGIALYYGGRADLALDDMRSFYQRDKNDGYRALWLYLAQVKAQPELAQAELSKNSQEIASDGWSRVLVDHYLGLYTQEQVFEKAKIKLTRPNEYAERLCETYFYMAKIAQVNQQDNAAVNLFRLALATNIYDFVEHRYARLELKLMASNRLAELTAKQAQ